MRGGDFMLLTKVQEVNGNQNTTSIPKEIVKKMKLEKKDRIIWEEKNGVVTLKKLVV